MCLPIPNPPLSSLPVPHDVSYANTLKTQKQKQKAQNIVGDFLAVQGLGPHASMAEDTGSVPGWRTKTLQATCCGQKNPKKHRLYFLRQF